MITVQQREHTYILQYDICTANFPDQIIGSLI